MKKLIILFISCLLIIPTVTSAHTTLSSSTPSQGEVITSELHEVTLEFGGEIEKQSTLTLTTGEKKITVESISVEGTTLTGHIAEPLENGDYTLTWNIVAKDGHLLSGDIPFTVNIEKEEAKVVEDVTENEEQEQNQANTNSEQEQVAEDELTNSKEETEQKEETTNNNRSLISTISIIVLVILLAIGIGILFRKKR
ncbi:copper resistance CopC family protein [Metabacillus malikii]|uniref:Methionine-rich copper-binding protein CopC n=1 Tax=Metabacillus malikii TaxID=1504265 RepID=A0ABT9ZAZ2_9BACI|nr:copper resistance CopC family protein [Metabacillus malikii]MDQ0229426.1 methionine-rich copper-binding protein CopC [Metabacillus malikii]